MSAKQVAAKRQLKMLSIRYSSNRLFSLVVFSELNTYLRIVINSSEGKIACIL